MSLDLIHIEGLVRRQFRLLLQSRLSHVAAVFCIMHGLTVLSNAQAETSNDSFRKFLFDTLGLTAEQTSSLDRREPVVTILRSKKKNEIAVFGIVRLEDLPEVTMQTFRYSLDQRRTQDYKAGGKLSDPPTLDDLTNLTFEDRDLEDLRSCVVGSCKVKLPASMIKTFGTDIDWNAPDHKVQAAKKLKQFLISYALDYLKRGDRAAIEYADKRKTVNLSEEYASLVDGNHFLAAIAPEVALYLVNFPHTELPGVENSVDWSKVNSALKPVISLTHGATFAKRSESNSILLIVTKQLYANHYIDASLSVAAVVQFKINGSFETYLVFENRSRSDALEGMFSEMIRDLTEKEAQKRVGELLARSNQRILTKLQEKLDPPDSSKSQGVWETLMFLKRPESLIVAALLLALASAIFLIRNRR